MEFKNSQLNQIKRGSKKAHYDKETINSILDASELCHVAFNDNDRAIVQPINYGRFNDKIYMHGSYKNRMTKTLIESGIVCFSVSILDALKVTRSAYHHSVNFRSVVVFGTVRELLNNEDKLFGLKTLINHFIPDRWDNCRKPTDKELDATRVIEITIESASAKIADSPNADKKQDLDTNYWAGQIPIKTICKEPIANPDLRQDIKTPQHILDYYEKRKNGL